MPLRQGSVRRVAPSKGLVAVCFLLVAVFMGGVGLSAVSSLRDTRAALSSAMDDVKSDSAAVRDAAVVIARMRMAELHRQHAIDSAQAAFFALQANANLGTLKDRLRSIAGHSRSVPAKQALEQVKVTISDFADQLYATGATGIENAPSQASERHTSFIETQFQLLIRTLDADLVQGIAASNARIRRLELFLLSVTLIGMAFATAAAWLLARRIATPASAVAITDIVVAPSTGAKTDSGEARAPRDAGVAAAFDPDRHGSHHLARPSPTEPDEIGRLPAAADTLRAAGEQPLSTDAHIARALDQALDGIMLIDPAGRISFANETATGRAGFADLLRASLSASRADEHEGEIQLADGRWLRVSRSHAPDGSVLAICNDVSATMDRLAQLDADNLNLRMALDCMSLGLCLFDAAHRLVVVNQRYCEIYGLDPLQVRRGMTGHQLVGLSVANGNHPGQSVADLFAEVEQAFACGHQGPFVQTLANERVVQIHSRPTADGGFVGTYEDVSDRWHAEARIAHMARHDSLTGLPNRILLAERIEGAITQASRENGFAVLCLDLDNFKPVNDGLGHAVGDELLRAVAHRLLACLRDIDTVARLGGDEFAIIQAGVESAEDVEILSRRIIEVVSKPYQLTHHTVTIGLSIGIALAPMHGMQADILLKNADVALYRAKDDGRGTRCFFEPEMDVRLRERRELERDLSAALSTEAFELYYQPIYDLRRDRICGFEALLRWNDPVRGSVSPADFVPIAEEIGIIVPLGEWVVRRACAQAASWPDDLKVAVNVSAAQFQSARLVEVIRSALEQSGLPPTQLELEITESVLLVNGAATRDILHALRGLGARVSMDDFGTGYSSLSYLRSFPFDKMKIDRSFIRDLTAANGSDFIVRAVISLGSSLGMTMTAEGVETEEQLARLREEDCDEVQGFLFSPPVPTTRLPALIERWNRPASVAA